MKVGGIKKAVAGIVGWHQQRTKIASKGYQGTINHVSRGVQGVCVKNLLVERQKSINGCLCGAEGATRE